VVRGPCVDPALRLSFFFSLPFSSSDPRHLVVCLSALYLIDHRVFTSCHSTWAAHLHHVFLEAPQGRRAASPALARACLTDQARKLGQRQRQTSPPPPFVHGCFSQLQQQQQQQQPPPPREILLLAVSPLHPCPPARRGARCWPDTTNNSSFAHPRAVALCGLRWALAQQRSAHRHVRL
jgi:hypothetical protein